MMNISKSRIIEIFLPLLLLGLASFFFFFFLFDYMLFYQEKEGLFLTSAEYFFEHFNRPGDILIYLSKFLTAFFYYPLVGSLILSSIIVLSAFLIYQIQNFNSGERTMIFPLLVGGTLLFIHSDYHLQLFYSLGIVFQLAAIYLFLRANWFLRGILPVIFFPVWYFVTGSLAFIFAIYYTLHLIHKKEKLGIVQVAVFWMLSLLFAYLSKEFFFYFSLNDLLSYPIETSGFSWRIRIYFTLAGLVMVLPIIPTLKIKILQKNQFHRILVHLALPVLIILTSVFVAYKQLKPKDKSYFQVEKLFYQDKFDEIIAYNLKNPSTNILTGFLNNIALSEQGKLTEMLFYFPQSADAKTLFLPWDMAREVLKRGGYFYYSIGMINEAHRWAYENMVMNGYSPEGLKMLIKTELINGNLVMAGKYIDLLDKSLFYRDEAAEFRKFTQDNNTLERNSDFGTKRNQKLMNDFFVLADDPLINLEAVIKSNPENQIALEYKMAFLLLRKDFNGVVNSLTLYGNKHRKYLPIHVEEAVVAYKTLGIGDAAVIETLNIRTETINRFASYLQTLKQYGNNKSAAQQALFKGFGDTFWYYVFYSS